MTNTRTSWLLSILLAALPSAVLTACSESGDPATAATDTSSGADTSTSPTDDVTEPLGDTAGPSPDDADDPGPDDAPSPLDDSADPDPGDTSDPDPEDTWRPPFDPDGASWAERFEALIPSDRVVPLTLDFADGDWAKLLEVWTTQQIKQEFPAALVYDGVSLASVGVRLKGLSSLTIPAGGTADPTGKHPLRIDFNAMGGPRLYDIDEVRLNNAVHDPSLMREWLTASVYRSLNVPVARLGHADVTIEGAYIGPYVLSQSVDKQFLKERYGTDADADDGNLYKCVYNGFNGCSLGWLGDAKADYVRSEGCAEGYDACGFVLETNEDDPALNDYADLIDLVRVVNETPANAVETELPKVFDVESFLRLAAVALATDNLDSYFGKGNNFFLYHRNDGRFEMIPWDFDGTYAGGCESPDFDPSCGGLQNHPLAARVLAVPAWKAQFLQHLCTLGTTVMTPAQHAAWIGALDDRVGALAAADPNASEQGTYSAAVDPSGEGDGNLYAYVAKRQAFLLTACPE